MALVNIGTAGEIVDQVSNAIGSNAVTDALGIDVGSILTPNKFVTKFTPSTVFAYRSLAYSLRTMKNFDVIFHWFPTCSQIRTMFSNAFSATDATELNLLVQSVGLPTLANNPLVANEHNNHFKGYFPGSGINGSSLLNMNILNTEFSFVAHCFYQWICETESPFWIYGPSVISDSYTNTLSNLKTAGASMYGKSSSIEEIEQGSMSELVRTQSQTQSSPFTRADIEIKYYSSNMKELHSLWFMGAFPVNIMLENPDNRPMSNSDDSHTVTFAYDSMCISSPFNAGNSNSITSKTLEAFNKGVSYGSSLVGADIKGNSAAWTAGLYDDTLTQVGNSYLQKLSRKFNYITNEAGLKLSEKLKSAQNVLLAKRQLTASTTEVGTAQSGLKQQAAVTQKVDGVLTKLFT